jgi:hypothetical protein
MSYRREDQYEYSANIAFYSVVGIIIILLLNGLWTLILK